MKFYRNLKRKISKHRVEIVYSFLRISYNLFQNPFLSHYSIILYYFELNINSNNCAITKYFPLT